jgi:hypothetical protein
LWPVPASAQDDDAHAAAHALAQEGAELFDKGDFQAALDRFKLAYDKFPTPKLFLNIGQSGWAIQLAVHADLSQPAVVSARPGELG